MLPSQKAISKIADTLESCELPQCFDRVFWRHPSTDELHCCALGAVFLGLDCEKMDKVGTRDAEAAIRGKLRQEFPDAAPWVFGRALTQIRKNNDDLHLTFKEIATKLRVDWRIA